MLQIVPSAGRRRSTKYAVSAFSTQVLRPNEVWLSPWKVMSRPCCNVAATLTACWYGVAESPVILSEGFAASVTDPCKSELPLDTVCWCWLCQE